ncbi:MAG TPA: DUF4290 domain-containing protein [Bacteroidales bacterium]|nr:DUF4290 domain-containing protein [Bacteroidales bacterium]HOH83503.1 DUF4290 domain-containing protein [Bacteroidales bacterium]HQP14953.1 DUF4290 domain-containing protein [Bacteroidales bacterium]
MEMEYNTGRPLLNITEYGRNVQKMIEYTMTLEDRDERNKAARTIVAIMATLCGNQKQDTAEFKQKMWDHLFMMSDYKLDVDAPFPKPDPETKENELFKCSYPNKFIKYRQYGKNIENMISRAIELEEGEEKSHLVRYIANHLKKLYISWNRDSVSDEVILEHLAVLSEGKLKLNENFKLENTRDLIAVNTRKKTSGSPSDNKNNKYRDKNWKKKKQQQQQQQ